MRKWQIPHGIGLTPSGHNNTGVEQFLNTIIDSLTREVIQNSLDASIPNCDKPVIVKFDKFKVDQKMIPSSKDIIDFALPKALEYWTEKNNLDTLKYLKLFSDTFNSKEIEVLKISDYNTTGLRQKNYDSLIVGNGYSEKDNIGSGGSKGIGKAAPFAASNLRMVFYNSLSIDNELRSAGIVNFVTFNYDDKNTTQERLSFYDDNNSQITFGAEVRKEKEYGTDLFIIGLKSFEEIYSEILLSAINNFLISIKKGELEVIVDSEKLNSKTINMVFDKLSNKKLDRNKKMEFNKTKNFYDVLTNEKTLSFKIDDKLVEKYSFIEKPDDGILYLLEHENANANRTILQTRSAGMKIYERKGIDGNINFSGIFQATGNKLNEFLKDMENANHDIWSPDRKEGKEKRIANDFLTDIFRWYKKMVKESFETSSEHEVEAFGVSSLLPIESSQPNGKSHKESGINNKIEKIEISRNSSKSQLMDGDKEEDRISKAIQFIGVDEGENSGSGSRRKGKGEGNNPNNFYGGGTGDDGQKSNSNSGEKHASEDIKKKGKIDSIKFKVIQEDYKNGVYKIIGMSKENANKIAVEFKYVGGDGKAYYLKLLNVNSDKHKTSIRQNNIIIEDIKKGDNLNIQFKINSKLKTKMEGSIYAIKS